MLAYRMVRFLFAPLVRLIYKVNIEGRNSIPKTGGVILACTHPRTRDPIMVPLLSWRPITFGAKSEFFRFRGWGLLFAPIFRLLKQLPVDRSGGRAAANFVEAAITYVGNRQGVLGIFPEGYLSPPDALHRFKTGVGRIAVGSGVPVIIVAIRYGDRTWRTLWRRPVWIKASYFGAFHPEDNPQDVTRRLDKAVCDLAELPTTSRYAHSDR
ncbi:MAG TPA: lysophospholipid acyltransferase family protein [Candidatus Saccharimonadales bacterium]|nr:lysophospholipid acyltransferase family protein [Candidatus Saccharimonadales bacterium]